MLQDFPSYQEQKQCIQRQLHISPCEGKFKTYNYIYIELLIYLIFCMISWKYIRLKIIAVSLYFIYFISFIGIIVKCSNKLFI